MEIILIRHGESQDNISKTYSRDTTKLSVKGIEQIKETKKAIEKLEYKKVYYSPLTRTKETLDYLELNGEPEVRIREMNFGIFTGKTFIQITEEYPRESQMWFDNYNIYKIPKGESLEMVYKRLTEFLDELMEQDENVLLITHEGIIRLACCWVFDNINHFFRFKADNGSINIISIDHKYKYISKLNHIIRKDFQEECRTIYGNKW